jgi:hypothetical protein
MCVCIYIYILYVYMNNVGLSFQLDDTTAIPKDKTLPVDGSIVFPIS